MASMLSSTNLVEHAANDDIETSPYPGSDQGRVRLADRIAAIKPARAKLAQEAEVEIRLPAVVPIVSTALVPYRVSEALSLEVLMRKPEPVPAAADPEASSDRVDAASTNLDATTAGIGGETTPRVSEVPSLSAGTRLAELILEQRALIEDLTRLSQRVAAVTSESGNALTGPGPLASPASDAHESLDVVYAAVATYPTPEPADAPAPASWPSSSQTASRSADDMIRALAAVVKSRPETDERTVAATAGANREPETSTASRSVEAYTPETSTSGSDWLRSPDRTSLSLHHAPEPLAIASLIDEGRPPMIIERAYTSLPEHELGRELPRAPGFVAGLALSGAVGLALFFALRIA